MKRNIHRDRKLLDLMHTLPCFLRGIGCEGMPAVPCHSNQLIHGKGLSMKAHDCFVAAGCNTCHHEIDNGKNLDKAAAHTLWRNGIDLTFMWVYGSGEVVLPVLDVEEWSALNAPRVYPFSSETTVAYPHTVTDEVWLQLWKEGRAHVA